MSRRKRQGRSSDPLASEKAELAALDLGLTLAEINDVGTAKPILAELIAAQKDGRGEEAGELAQQLVTHGVYVGEIGDDEPPADDTPPLDFTPLPGVPQPDDPAAPVAEDDEDEERVGDDAEPGEVREYDPEAEDPPEWEEQAEVIEPLRPPAEVDLDEPPVFPLGPLAAGIQMLDAMLEQAKGGYISERVDQLEAVLREEFGPEERMLIADYASRFRDGMGLPDVSGAYEQLVARRAEQARAEG